MSQNEDCNKLLRDFIYQAQMGDLKTSSYPKTWGEFRLRVSFGQGAPARIPWVAFITPEMEVSRGFYPVYLYYKAEQVLILAYGISETEDYNDTWSMDVQNNFPTITSFFDKEVPRYGNSFVYKAYKINFAKRSDTFVFEYVDTGQVATEKDLESDLQKILDYYREISSEKIKDESSLVSKGLFYMEKQLEDFLIENWDSTDLGRRFSLIYEKGDLISQQYRTKLGPIDILAKDRRTNSYVVIELKRNQTSDDTVGQVTRYMEWIKEEKKDPHVKGVIIAGSYDLRLDYAQRAMPNVEVYLYDVIFSLRDFKTE